MEQLLQDFAALRGEIDDVPFTLPAADIETALAAWDKERAA